MKNIFLIGDSIRFGAEGSDGYGIHVAQKLAGKANVYAPEENCRFASYVLRYLHEYKKILRDDQVDVLHWNAGLWDCLRLFGEEPQTPLGVYTYYIERICKRIQKLFPGTKVIFATSTSVRSELMKPDFKRYNEEIEVYNAAAVKIVSKYGFQVNDLYTVSLTLPEEAHSDPVHYYTSIGTKIFTEQVLSHLLPALDIEEKPEYKEVLYTDKPIGI